MAIFWLSHYFSRYTLPFIIVIFCCFSTPTIARAAKEIQLNEDESYIVTVELENLLLSDGIIIYHSKDLTLIPLQVFSDILEYAIIVAPQSQQADGWFINEANTFHLNLTENTVFISEKDAPKKRGILYGVDDFDIYIDVDTLSSWFNITLNFNMSQQSIGIQSEHEQPIQIRKKREKLHQRTSKNSQNTLYPIIEDQYQWLGAPVMDLRYGFYQNDTGSLNAFSLQAAMDILKHESRLTHTASDGDDLATTRLTFYRDSTAPNKSIFLGVHHYEFGDLYKPQDKLISNSSSGVGLALNNRTDRYSTNTFTARDIQGEAPPGWDAELYRNGILLDFQKVTLNGQYIFPDIDTEYGENIFEVVLYGPQGQKRTVTSRYNIGDNQLKSKQWLFDVNVIKENKVLIEHSQPSLLPYKKGANDAATPLNLAMSAGYGLTQRHAMGVRYDIASPNPLDDAHHYARVNWSTHFSGVASRFSFVKDITENSNAANIELSGRLGKQSFTIDSQYFDQFKSQRSANGALRSNSEIRLFGALNLKQRTSIPYTFRFRQQKSRTGGSQYFFENKLNFSMSRYRFTHTVDATATRLSDTQTSGSLSIHRGIGFIHLRGGLSYDLNHLKTDAAAASISASTRDWRYQVQGSQSLDSEPSEFSLSVLRYFGNLGVSLEATKNSRTQWYGGISFEIGASGKDRFPSIELDRYGKASTGSSKIFVFHDADYDGKFGGSDTPIAGARVKGRQDWSYKKTGDDGTLILRNLDARSSSNLTLDEVSLNDPYLSAAAPTVTVYSHAGGQVALHYPVISTLEAEGFIYLASHDRKGVGGVEIGLYEDGTLIQKTKTEYDGYYLFEKIKPGNYTLSLINAQSLQRRYSWNPIPTQHILPEDAVTYIPDLVLTRKNNPP